MPSLPAAAPTSALAPHHSLVAATGSERLAAFIDVLADNPDLVARLRHDHRVTDDRCEFGAPAPDRRRCKFRVMADLAQAERDRRDSVANRNWQGFTDAIAWMREVREDMPGGPVLLHAV